MHRFFVPPGTAENGLVLLDREAHHAVDVLRLRPADVVVTLNGCGLVRQCSVDRCSRGRVELTVLSEKQFPKPPASLMLAQGVVKGKLFDSIVQKATEIGAFRIVPLLTDRVVVELGEANAERKAAKWQTAAIEAAKQCGTPWLPQIDPPVRLRTFLAQKQVVDLSLVACLLPYSRHPRVCLNQFRQAHQAHPKSACLFIGPEGDFTGEEYAAIEESGALPITLGKYVLRAETAAVFGLAILSYELMMESGHAVEEFRKPR